MSKSNGEYEVVMGLHTCEQLLDFLQERIPHVEPPSLSNLAPTTYEILERFEATSSSLFQRYQQKAKKKNKSQAKLREAKELSELARELIHAQKHIFFSIDIEAYELDHSILLEIGWSMYDARADKFLDQHYAIDTYKHLTNGRYVEDQRDKFTFGPTVWCSLKQAFKELRKDLDWAVERDGGFVLVGHGIDSDIKYLKDQKFLWPKADKSDTLDVEEAAKVATLNTDVLYGASIDNLHNPPSLGTTLSILKVDTWNLHNAGKKRKKGFDKTSSMTNRFLFLGNDAHYTLLLLLKLAE